MKAMTPEEGEQIKEAIGDGSAEREAAALDELRQLGFKTPLVEEGLVHCVIWATDGRRKTFSGATAQAVLVDAQGWLRFQESCMPETRFHPADGPTAVPVVARVAGDTATTRARREATERRVIAFDGRPRLVDSMGDEIAPSSEANAPASGLR